MTNFVNLSFCKPLGFTNLENIYRRKYLQIFYKCIIKLYVLQKYKNVTKIIKKFSCCAF